MPPDVMIMHLGVDVVRVEPKEHQPSTWEKQLKRYHEQKARTAAIWDGIDKRRQFVLQHCSTAPCVPARW